MIKVKGELCDIRVEFQRSAKWKLCVFLPIGAQKTLFRISLREDGLILMGNGGAFNQ